MAAETTRAVGYIRTATTTPTNKEHWTAGQAQRIRQYCCTQGLALVGSFVDCGVMGDSRACRGLRDALSLLRTGQADLLIVVNVSRLSRSAKRLARLLDAYFADGSRALVALDERIDTRTAKGRFLLNLLPALARWESEEGAHA